MTENVDMSADADKNTACPNVCVSSADSECYEDAKKKKTNRTVCFPDEEHIVTQYFEPANPWHDGKSSILAQYQIIVSIFNEVVSHLLFPYSTIK